VGEHFGLEYAIGTLPLHPTKLLRINMASIVCELVAKPEQVSFTWSEGPASFAPYQRTGQYLIIVRRLVEEATKRPGDLVKDYLFSEQRRGSEELVDTPATNRPRLIINSISRFSALVRIKSALRGTSAPGWTGCRPRMRSRV
jgi:hypothetical protein